MEGDSDKRKLEELAGRIRKAEEAADPSRRERPEWSRSSSRGMIRAIRIGTDFVASVVVPAALGVYLDEKLGTSPWLMILMVFGGFGLGMSVLLSAFRGKTTDDEEEK